METTPNIRKKEEFEAFISSIEEGSQSHWIDIARAIGVDKDTISEWKKHPRASQAIIKGIQHSLSQMESVGSKDWRMWDAKLKMLGLNPTIKTDITSDDAPIQAPIIYIPQEDPNK